MLIESLALRCRQAALPAEMAPLPAEVCGRPKYKRPDPLDAAYAERMYGLVQRWPGDPDVLSLWAEAEMIATRDDWLSPAVKPPGRIGEVADRLRGALAGGVDHTGLNHCPIHAVDTAGPEVHRAVASADRLAPMAPMSPHLVHMPARIHVRVGQYADAARGNQRALELDDLLDASLQVQGLAATKDRRSHNLAFAWFSAVSQSESSCAARRSTRYCRPLRRIVRRAAKGRSQRKPCLAVRSRQCRSA